MVICSNLDIFNRFSQNISSYHVFYFKYSRIISLSPRPSCLTPLHSLLLFLYINSYVPAIALAMALCNFQILSVKVSSSRHVCIIEALYASLLYFTFNCTEYRQHSQKEEMYCTLHENYRFPLKAAPKTLTQVSVGDCGIMRYF